MQEEERLDILALEYEEKGRKAFEENRMEEAVYLVQNAAHLYKKIPDYARYTASMNLIGVIYDSMGNETMAVDYYLDALETAFKHKYSHAKVSIYNNIGSRYQKLKEYRRAVSCFERAIEVLKEPECSQEEHYDTWCTIVHLNLASSFAGLEQYEQELEHLKAAKKYLHDGALVGYRYYVLQYRLYWKLGKADEVRKNTDVLLECAMKSLNELDYEENIKDICDLFQQMGEYENWKRVLLFFEEHIKNADSVYFRLVLTEMWMDYYEAIGNQQKYVELCVEHTRLYRQQKCINERQRSEAIDIRIQLREKEVERKRAEKRSNRDALTGLGNRYLLEKDISNLFLRMEKQGGDYAIGLIDIDSFKKHNDTFGHIHGDSCLRMVASALKEGIRGRGKAYRFGGDEFVLLINKGEEENIRQIAEKIKQKIQSAWGSNAYSNEKMEVTVSQGYAIVSSKEKIDQKKLISYADKALYYVKKNGRNGYFIMQGQELKD